MLPKKYFSQRKTTEMRPRLTIKAWTETTNVKRKVSNSKNISNSFLDSVRPVFLVLRIFGRFPHGISENEIQSFRKTSPITAYSVVLYIIILYLTSRVLGVLTHKLVTSESYKDSLRSIMAISYLIHYLLIPFTDWLLGPTLIKCINLWHRYECQFNEEFATFPYKDWVQFLSYSTWPMAVYFSYYSAYELCDNNFFLPMVYFPLIHSTFQYVLLWLFCQLYQVRQARKLKEIVISRGLDKRMERTRQCWLLLSELISTTGYSIGLVLTTSATTSFLGLIIYCYGFLTSILDNEDCVDWQMGFMVFSHLIIFFILFDSADRTTKEVGRNFQLAVFVQKFSQLDEESRNQLVLLLTTFRLHPPTIQAAGFIESNRQTFLSLLRNSLTYLIVLVQFKT